VAQRALPPGAIQRRACFGLLDANGWPWAFLKALFWFSLLIFLLGYIPDRAYYFTVFPTIDVGTNIISPINFCDGANKSLPCPAPPGSVIPWDNSPAQLALPQARTEASTVQFGTTLFLVGGEVGGAPTDSVLQTQATTDGNFAPWTQGPKLPAPRADAIVLSFNGAPYVIGGTGPDGKPTDTTFVGQLNNGQLTSWKEDPNLKLPEPLSGAAGIPGAASIWVIGGRTANGLSDKVYRSLLDSTTSPPALKPFAEAPALALRDGAGHPAARADSVAVSTGAFIWLMGGETANGPTNTLMRLGLDPKGEPLPAGDNLVQGWATSTGPASLPGPRTLAAGFTANESIYVVGGQDASGKATTTFYWTTPNASTGEIDEWHRLDQTELPAASQEAATAVVGSFVFLIGGTDGANPVATSVRADLAPRPAFFRLGLIGATIPSLAIKGEIGQQLGYLSAAGAGTVDFIVLILIGLSFSHRRGTAKLIERASRGRYRPPPDDDLA
jgi:hypothetical protein